MLFSYLLCLCQPKSQYKLITLVKKNIQLCDLQRLKEAFYQIVFSQNLTSSSSSAVVCSTRSFWSARQCRLCERFRAELQHERQRTVVLHYGACRAKQRDDDGCPPPPPQRSLVTAAVPGARDGAAATAHGNARVRIRAHTCTHAAHTHTHKRTDAPTRSLACLA